MNTLGIIAGGGLLPVRVMEHCHAHGRPLFVLGLEGATDMRHFSHVPHAKIKLTSIGEGFAHLRAAGAKEIVLAGDVKRPSLIGLKPDATGTKLLARLSTKIFAGDDAILKTVIAFLEEEGFSVIGTDKILGGLLASLGVLGKIKPNTQQQADIKKGLAAAKALGADDIGQAVMVENGRVLACEDEHGTNALIERAATLNHHKDHGVLVKAKKPQQDARVDLPTIGVTTVEKIHAAGFAGIAVEADATIIIDMKATIARADALGIFVVGAHG